MHLSEYVRPSYNSVVVGVPYNTIVVSRPHNNPGAHRELLYGLTTTLESCETALQQIEKVDRARGTQKATAIAVYRC